MKGIMRTALRHAKGSDSTSSFGVPIVDVSVMARNVSACPFEIRRGRRIPSRLSGEDSVETSREGYLAIRERSRPTERARTK